MPLGNWEKYKYFSLKFDRILITFVKIWWILKPVGEFLKSVSCKNQRFLSGKR